MKRFDYHEPANLDEAVKLLRCYQSLAGQIEGGLPKGIGHTLYEDYQIDLHTGRSLNANFVDYKMPLSMDMRPIRVVLGAYLFGGVMISQLFVQGLGLKLDVPAQFLSALPYAATIAVLVLISRNAASIRLHSPVSLGLPYRPDAYR